MARRLGKTNQVPVEVIGVSKNFANGDRVIDNLSFVIKPGEFISLLGPSGCGKSTLLRMIAGLEPITQGEIRTVQRGEKFYRGFVFQEPALLPWRTVLENVVLPLELMRRSRAEAEEIARDWLSRVGLLSAVDKFPNQLSGGMKMRVSVARAMVAEPALLLLDEPFAALDEITRHRLQEDLFQLWSELKMTVIFVTHSVAEATFVSSRAVVMSAKPGRVRLDFTFEQLGERNALLRSSPLFAKTMAPIYAALREEAS